MTSQKKSVALVVDDEPMIRDLITQVLTKNGFECVEAANGEEALELQKTKAPDLVVTDYAMPKVDGEMLLARLKERQLNIPVIVVTGEIPDSILLSMLKYERFAALHKPFRSNALVRAVNYVMNRPLVHGGKEKRKFFRLDTEIRTGMGKYGNGIIKNISPDGLFIETLAEISLGSNLTVEFTLRHDLKINGKVVWVRNSQNLQKLPPGVGVQFKELSPQTYAMIQKYLVAEINVKKIGWFGEEG